MRAAARPSPSEAQQLAGAIASLTERVASGAASGAEIDALTAQARTVAETASDADRAALVDVLAELEQAVAKVLDVLGAELRQAGQRRRALAGFRSVRAWTTAQNLRTRV